MRSRPSQVRGVLVPGSNRTCHLGQLMAWVSNRLREWQINSDIWVKWNFSKKQNCQQKYFSVITEKPFTAILTFCSTFVLLFFDLSFVLLFILVYRAVTALFTLSLAIVLLIANSVSNFPNNWPYVLLIRLWKKKKKNVWKSGSKMFCLVLSYFIIWLLTEQKTEKKKKEHPWGMLHFEHINIPTEITNKSNLPYKPHLSARSIYPPHLPWLPRSWPGTWSSPPWAHRIWPFLGSSPLYQALPEIWGGDLLLLKRL